MSRRSERQTANDVKAIKERIFLLKVKQNSQAGLEIFDAGVKGRGIRATMPFSDGDYVATYQGEIVTHREAIRRCERAVGEEHIDFKYCQ